MASYLPPAWAATEAPAGYSLEILKEGTIIETVQLDAKTHYIMGRMGGSVDILMEHLSISRHHCCLQFRDDGILMALDLGSAQGSFLNKTKLDKEVYQRVNVGDILRFGASTRMYIVNGPAEQMPSEYDSANMKAYREKLAQHSAKIEAKKLEVATAGASWGFDEDAENPVSDEDEETEELPDYVKNDDNYSRKHGKKYSAGLGDETTSENNVKDAAILEKIRAKERKIQNMQEEIRRIYLKESSQPDGLTEGQSAAVSRNDKRIEELKESIGDMLDQLKTKTAHREGKSSTGEKKVKKIDIADGDEMLDTTCQTADISTNWRLKKKMAKQGDGIRDIKSQNAQIGGHSGVVLTYEDLKKQKDEQSIIVEKLRRDMNELEQIMKSVKEYFATVESKRKEAGFECEEDAVEKFVLEARAKEASSSLKLLRIEEGSAVTKLNSLEKLLKIATPALISLSDRTAKKIPTLVAERSFSSSENIKSRDISHIPNPVGEDDDNSDLNRNDKTCTNTASLSTSDDKISDESKASSSTPYSGNIETSNIEKKKIEHEKKESKKRARIDDIAHMQSLSSFMKFAEEEKRKVDLEEKRKELQELRESNGTSEKEGEEIQALKVPKNTGPTVRSVNEFSNNEFETSKIDVNKETKNPKKIKGPIGPKGPPNNTNSSDVNVALDSKKKGPQSPPLGNVLEGGESVWIPPKNQTGDGRTALNARLGY